MSTTTTTPIADQMRALVTTLNTTASSLDGLADQVALLEHPPPPVTHTIGIVGIPQQTVGAPFNLSGNLGGYGSTAPALQYQDGPSGAWTAIPATVVTATGFVFSHPAFTAPAASMSISVRDAGSPPAVGASNTFAVVAAVAAVNALTTTSGGSITMSNGHVLTITSAGNIQDNHTDIPGGSGSSACAYVNNQIWGQDAGNHSWWIYAGTGSNWTSQPAPPPNLVYPPSVPPPATGNFAVTAAAGFVDPAGHAWISRGLNANVSDIQGCGMTVMSQYPGLNTIRLCVGNNANGYFETDAEIDWVVQLLTPHGVVIQIEDHSGNGANTGWYSHMATIYKSNPYVFLETPNEPSAPASQTSQNQIAIINAIRAAGFNNPIGLQPCGGYDGSNLAAVVNACGTKQIFCTPHLYYYQNDPNYAAGKVTSWIDNNRTQLGLWSSFDEFGNDAGDGVTLAPQGNTVITAVISACQAGRCGGVFWAMGNGHHPDGVDSAFATLDGTQLTPIGAGVLKAWLS